MPKKKQKRRKRKKKLNFDSKINKHFQKKREKLFRPIVKDLKKMGVSANMLSNLRIFLAILFVPLFVYSKPAGAIFMLFILFLDMLDGPLAKYQKTASDRGKFIDMSADHVVYSIILSTFVIFGADTFLLGFNFFIIPVVYILAIIKKQEFEKSDWIIKPYPRLSYLKLLPVLAFFCASFFQTSSTLINWALVIPNIIATLLAVYYFLYIQVRWKVKEE